MSDKQQALVLAKRLEQASRVDDAVRAYLQAGSLSDAVRVLVGAQRYLDAANLVMRALKVPTTEVSGLQGQHRRLAHRAATYYAHAGVLDVALTLFEGLGDDQAVSQLRAMMRAKAAPPSSSHPPRSSQVHELRSPAPPSRGAPPVSPPPSRGARPVSPPPRSSQLPISSPSGFAASTSVMPPAAPVASAVSRQRARQLEQSGDLEVAREAYLSLRMFADAARVTRELGDPAGAAALFSEGGRPFDAAACFVEAGNPGEALAHLVRVPRDDPNYRAACARAIRVARELNVLDFDLDRFVGRFVRSGPKGPRELSAFYALGRLYEAHDFSTSAVDVYERILGQDDAYLDVADRLQDIEGESHGSEMVFEKIVREDESFIKAPLRRSRSNDRMAQLPELPDLPDLESIPRARSRPPRDSEPSRGRGPDGAGRRARWTEDDADAYDRVTDLGDGPPSRPPRSQPAQASPPPRSSVPDGRSFPPGPEQAGPVGPGSVIAGRYTVTREIGEGGMAMVYEVLDGELDLPIALKLFSADADDKVLLGRFKRELMLARELTHENIVRVFDIGVHAGRRFITMELLDGMDLRDAMGGPSDIEEAIRYLIQMCAGLHVAHLRGIVHRDIKPENFFLTHGGVVKVMDFGIAKKASVKSHLTQEGYTAGTPAYMAPEQIKDFGQVTHQCDVYALGIIAYEMLTGELPFYHDEPMPLMMMQIENEVPPPRLLRPELSEELEATVLDCLAKRPADRVKSCAELADRLEEALEHLRRPV